METCFLISCSSESQVNTQRYGRRPFGVGLLVAGFDVSSLLQLLCLKNTNIKLDIVFVETNTRCSAIVGSVFESMKKVLLIARQIAKKSKPNSFLDV